MFIKFVKVLSLIIVWTSFAFTQAPIFQEGKNGVGVGLGIMGVGDAFGYDFSLNKILGGRGDLSINFNYVQTDDFKAYSIGPSLEYYFRYSDTPVFPSIGGSYSYNISTSDNSYKSKLSGKSFSIVAGFNSKIESEDYGIMLGLGIGYYSTENAITNKGNQFFIRSNSTEKVTIAGVCIPMYAAIYFNNQDLKPYFLFTVQKYQSDIPTVSSFKIGFCWETDK